MREPVSYTHLDVYKRQEFYKRQAAGAEITSSLPSPGDVMDMWEALLKEHDEVVYIPMTSGLSTRCV